MADAGFASTHISQIEAVPLTGAGGLAWRPVRAHFDIGGFGVNVWTARDAGAEVIGPHVETDEQAGGHEELYFVVSGHAIFTVAGQDIDAPAGTFVFVRDPTLTRAAVAREPGTALLVVGGKVGAPYSVAAWEFIVRAGPAYSAGEYERAAEEIRRGLEHHPDSTELLYHLACFESLADETDSALIHLRRAIELNPRIRERAAREPDLDPIRD